MPSDDKVKGPALYFPPIEKTYGKAVADGFAILDTVQDQKPMDQVPILKKVHGVGHGYPNALVAYHRANANG